MKVCHFHMIALFFLLFATLTACATTSSSKGQLSPKEEARYAAAIQKAEAEQPSAISDNEKYVVSVGPSAAQTAAETLNLSSPERSFNVSREEYDAFFAQSPAVILSRMKLSPIQDGGSFLGYRIVSIKQFQGVDLEVNDIIVGIDGVLPANPDVFFNSWEKAKKSSKCTVNVQRSLDRFDLTWSVTP